MIFQNTWEQVLNGTKTEIRQLRKVGDRPIYDIDGTIVAVATPTGYTRYRVGNRYIIQPGRRQRMVGWFILQSIRFQWLPFIDDQEVQREGFPHATAFWATWTAKHQVSRCEVWVLEIGMVRKVDQEES